MQIKSVVYSASLAGVVAAQAPTNNYTSQQLNELLTQGSQHFVDATTRENWCTGQHTACSLLCGAVNQNQCDPTKLTWDCTCASNNSAPGLQWYTTSMANVLCNTLNGDCMADNANDLTAQQGCNTTFVCVNNNITKLTSAASTSSASAAPSSSATGSPTGSASSSASTPSASSSAAMALAVGERFGVGILGAGVFAVLGLVL